MTKSKKVLIITYYWPPAGGAGVQRILKFAKYLPQFGWEPVILTVRHGEYPAIDHGFEKEIPPGIKIYKTASFQPFGFYRRITGRKKDSRISNDIFTNRPESLLDRIAKWIRLNVFIPDARIGWYCHGVRGAKHIIETEKPDLIFSSSPPHSLQLIAKKAAKLSGVKWVADFRDPWSELVHYQSNRRSGFTKKIDAALERSVLTHADAIVTVGNDAARCIRKHADRPVEVIYNGYDAEDIPRPSEKKDDRFVITYTGELSKDRIPLSFIRGMSAVVERHPEVRIQFVGNTCPELKREIRLGGLEDKTIYKAYMPHEASLKALAESDALLLVINNVPDNKGIITGKIFEYMGMRKPIICIGPEDGDAAEILAESSAGICVSHDDPAKAEKVIENIILGNYRFDFRVTAYERRNEAGQLAAIFDRLVSRQT